MNWPQWLLDLQHHSPHLIKAVLAGTLVSTVCGAVGCFIVLRRTAFLADALAHSMLAGVVCGYLVTRHWFGPEAHTSAMIIGSVLSGLFTVGMVGFVSRFSRLKQDAVIGIMYTGVFALGGVILSLNSHLIHFDLNHFLTGQLLSVRNSDLWMMAIVASFVLAVIVMFFRQLQLISFDPVMAASIGVPVLALEYLLTGCTSLVVVAGVNVVGVILVVGLLIIPAATAYLLCDRLSRMLVSAALFGLSSFAAGYAWSEWQNIAPGSAVVVASTAQFLLVFVAAPKYGLFADWQRRWRAVPQRLMEDVLGSVLRSRSGATLQTLSQHVSGGVPRVRRAVRRLVRQELLEERDSKIALTVAGRHEAERLLRAHRLWETYLQHVGTPDEQLHDRAHRLEHVHDQAAIDYLDDKLGHPLQDPHGAEIPLDVSLVAGSETFVAALREGHVAEVLDVGPAARGTPLKPGDEIRLGPRSADGHTWTVISKTSQHQVDHAAADAIRVRLLGDKGQTPP